MAGAGAEDRPEAAAASEVSRDATIFRSKVFEGLAGTDLKKLEEAERAIHRAQGGKTTELFLSDLELVSLPGMIGTILTLTHLNCAGNQLTTLPDSLGSYTTPMRVRCGGNPWDVAWLRAQGLKLEEDPTPVSLKKLAEAARLT